MAGMPWDIAPLSSVNGEKQYSSILFWLPEWQIQFLNHSIEIQTA